MNEIIKKFIFEETFNTYNHECYLSEDLYSLMADLNEEIELALNCYYRFEDEERDPEVVQRAWDMYITVREYNISIINGIKKVLRGR